MFDELFLSRSAESTEDLHLAGASESQREAEPMASSTTEPTALGGEAHGEEETAGMPTDTETLAAASVPINPVGGGTKPSGDAPVGEA
jgi:hypothetical protein